MTDDAQHNLPHDDRASETRSYIALAFVAVFVVVAVWVVRSFRDHNRRIECFEAHRHDCMPLDTSEKGPPR